MNPIKKLSKFFQKANLFATQFGDALTEEGIKEPARLSAGRLSLIYGDTEVAAVKEETLDAPAGVTDPSIGDTDVIHLTNRQRRLLLSSGKYRINVISYHEKKGLKHISGPKIPAVRRFTTLKVGDRPDGYIVAPFIVATSLLERYKSVTGKDYALEDVRTTQLLFSTENAKKGLKK